MLFPCSNFRTETYDHRTTSPENFNYGIELGSEFQHFENCVE